MIKNELMKFFTPLKLSLYIGFLLMCILLPLVVFADKVTLITGAYEFVYGSMMDVLILVIPVILAPIVSEVFTYDYECGCMKFFLIYKTRKKVLFSKLIALIVITAVLIGVAFLTLIIIYIIQNPIKINVLCSDLLLILKMMIKFLIALIPIIFIYTSISITFKSSTITSILTFLLVMMSDIFVKYIADITPTRFFRFFLQKGKSIDNFSISLFSAYIIVFLILNIKLFSKKEMLK